MTFCTFGGYASGERDGSGSSPLGVSFVVNGYKNETWPTLGGGPACCFVFGYLLGLELPPWGPPLHPGGAVHRQWCHTALHYAAAYGNLRIVRKLIAANACVNAEADNG